MGAIHTPRPVKLFIGMLSSDPALFDACAEILSEKYGHIDYESDIIAWKFTDYYAEEMGAGLLRKFIFFEKLIDPGELAGVKLFTNKTEEQAADKTAASCRRRINLDPGYITEAKVVLATTKDYSHRIYIGDNIYADVTLQYKGRTFTPLEHTYPDYRAKDVIDMFNKARELLRSAMHKKGI